MTKFMGVAIEAAVLAPNTSGLEMDVISELYGAVQIHSYETLIRDRFKDRHTFEVVYEKLKIRTQETFKYIGEYLGIDDVDINNIILKKQNPESL